MSTVLYLSTEMISMLTNRRDAVATLGTLAGACLLQQSPARAAVPQSPIKIGQIGVGHAHATKLSVYRKSPDYEVVGIVEPDPALRKAAETSEVYRGLPWMTEEQLLNISGLQAVLVETRVRDSLRTAGQCIAAGKHVHLDKPAGASLPDYTQLLEQAAERKLMVQMGYMYRYNPAILMLHEFIEQGWLGEIFEVHTVMSKVVPPADRSELAEFAGGIMFELGCHIIDLVVGVLGAPDRITPFAKRVDRSDSLVDNMLAVFDYPQATATVKTTAVEVEGFARRHFVVCGTAGTFHIQPLDNPQARVALSEPRGGYRKGYQEIEFPRFERYVADAADMAQVIRGEKPMAFSYAHDLAVQTAVLKASQMI
jgi:predicted dehydrogenase